MLRFIEKLIFGDCMGDWRENYVVECVKCFENSVYVYKGKSLKKALKIIEKLKKDPHNQKIILTWTNFDETIFIDGEILDKTV